MPRRKFVSLSQALASATILAKEGPRVAAVARVFDDAGAFKGYAALPGFMDANNKHFDQTALVTPDGRIWTRNMTDPYQGAK